MRTEPGRVGCDVCSPGTCEADASPRRPYPSCIRALSTSNSHPGASGSKPCSLNQRATTRLRSDHQARITSRSAPAAVAGEQIVQAFLVPEGQDGEVVHGVTGGGLGPVDDPGDLAPVDEHVGELQVAVDERRRPRPERRLRDLPVAIDHLGGQDSVLEQPGALPVELCRHVLEPLSGPRRQRGVVQSADDRARRRPRRRRRGRRLAEHAERLSRGRSRSPVREASCQRISGVGTGTMPIARISTSACAGSPSIFRNISPTRSVARSLWATTTSTSSMPVILAETGHGMSPD